MTFDLPINSNVDHCTLVVNRLRHDCLTRHAKAPSGAKPKVYPLKLDSEALVYARDLGGGVAV